MAPSRFSAEAMNIFFRTDNKLMTFRDNKFASRCEPKARLVPEALRLRQTNETRGAAALQFWRLSNLHIRSAGSTSRAVSYSPGMLKPEHGRDTIDIVPAAMTLTSRIRGGHPFRDFGSIA